LACRQFADLPVHLNAVSRRIGKKGVYYWGMIWWIAVSFLLFIVQPSWSPVAIIVLGTLAGVGVATAYLIPWAMLPDVIELDELKTGRRREGAYYGFFVLLQKLGLALGLFLVSQGLAIAGYVTPPAGATTAIAQPDTPFAIRLMIGPPRAILLADYLVPFDHEEGPRETFGNWRPALRCELRRRSLMSAGYLLQIHEQKICWAICDRNHLRLFSSARKPLV
jgi:MFS family permease